MNGKHGQVHTGSCLCGKVTLTAAGAPVSVAACHCNSCRKHTGAPVSVFVDYPQANVRFTDAYPEYFESSPGSHRGFCRSCGSTICFVGDNLPEMIHLHIGVFESPDDFSPTENEKTDSQLRWVTVATKT